MLSSKSARGCGEDIYFKCEETALAFRPFVCYQTNSMARRPGNLTTVRKDNFLHANCYMSVCDDGSSFDLDSVHSEKLACGHVPVTVNLGVGGGDGL
jgi:hypothetical protein